MARLPKLPRLPKSVGLLPKPVTRANRSVSLPELGLRGSVRLTQTIIQLYPRAAKWLIKRKVPPAKEVRELFEALGATYIKFGQFIASSPSIFPTEYVEEFQLLLDQTEPMPFNKIKQIVEKDLNKPINQVFSFFDPEPLASASIAQVHAAILDSGEDVVVKVQKPGVATEIMVDLHTVYLMTRLMELILPNMDQDAIAGIIEEMYQSMIDECDFEKEAENLDHFREFLKNTGNQEVVAPKPYHQVSGPKVLVMERLYGCSMADRAALSQHPGNPSGALFNALNTWFASLTACDFFHADLHSGNMLLLNDGRVGFIDFGMVGRVKPEAWEAMFNLFTALGNEDYRGIAEAMLAVGITRDEVDMDRLTVDIRNLFMSMQSVNPETMMGNLGQGKTDDINEMMIQLGEIGKNYGIRFPRAFTMLLKQFLYFDRYIQILEPGGSVFDNPNIEMLPGQ
jgi:predicted unusual protein kinase regulating ubiquinone biosynthesis (AarF/ABC1/UbiB family)